MENNENNSTDIVKDNSTVNSNESSMPDPSQGLLQKTEETVRRLEEANQKREELLKREENLIARGLLAGRSEAGTSPPPPKPREEQIKDEVNLMFKDLSPFKKKN